MYHYIRYPTRHIFDLRGEWKPRKFEGTGQSFCGPIFDIRPKNDHVFEYTHVNIRIYRYSIFYRQLPYWSGLKDHQLFEPKVEIRKIVFLRGNKG